MKLIDYPIHNNSLPFSNYLKRCRDIIEEHRIDIQQNNMQKALIVDSNMPYELYPEHPIKQGNKLKYGALLIHGLLDSPFSFKEIGLQLQAEGILTRAILLPGHGTNPKDLMNVTYQDWIQSVRYGVETLRRAVDSIFLVGYSTGAALSIIQALEDPANIAGLVLISPAIKIKAPVNAVVAWCYLTSLLGKSDRHWIFHEEEIDYAKYTSIPFHAYKQVARLTDKIQALHQGKQLIPPLFMALSHEDETISSSQAIKFFTRNTNPKNKALLYSSREHHYKDQRITLRPANKLHSKIKHFSHIALPFSAENPHYGRQGDFPFASRLTQDKMLYGAYNRIEVNLFELLYDFGLVHEPRRILTFNPDFEYMVTKAIKFILKQS